MTATRTRRDRFGEPVRDPKPAGGADLRRLAEEQERYRAESEAVEAWFRHADAELVASMDRLRPYEQLDRSASYSAELVQAHADALSRLVVAYAEYVEAAIALLEHPVALMKVFYSPPVEHRWRRYVEEKLLGVARTAVEALAGWLRDLEAAAGSSAESKPASELVDRIGDHLKSRSGHLLELVRAD